MSLDRCHLIQFPGSQDQRGNLCFIEGARHIPFPIRRVYYLYDVPEEATRGGHGHKKLEQVIIAVSGAFDVALDDGRTQTVKRLSRASEGLYICPGMWRELKNFAASSVCLVLASEVYVESDYFREYSAFIDAVKQGMFPA